MTTERMSEERLEEMDGADLQIKGMLWPELLAECRRARAEEETWLSLFHNECGNNAALEVKLAAAQARAEKDAECYMRQRLRADAAERDRAELLKALGAMLAHSAPTSWTTFRALLARLSQPPQQARVLFCSACMKEHAESFNCDHAEPPQQATGKEGEP